MRRMTIGRRLFMGFGVLIGFNIIGLSMGVWAIERLTSTDDEVVHNMTERIVQGEFQVELESQVVVIHNYLLNPHDTTLAEYEKFKTSTQSLLDEFVALSDEHSSELQSALEQLHQAADGLLGLGQSDTSGSGPEDRYDLMETQLESIHDILEMHEVELDQMLDIAFGQANDTRQFLTRLFVGLIVLTIVAGPLISFVISRSITRPTRSLTWAAERLADGELSQPISSAGRDEVALLAASFELMRGELAMLVSKLQSAIDRANASASEMTMQSQSQASASSEQAASVTEVTASIEELSRTAQAIAGMADRVARAVERALDGARAGQEAAVTSTRDAESVRTKMDAMAQRIQALGDRSQQIGSIVALIGEIASETHLLSLNASIEAASAGEHGKRFAVVAAEVKRLAERASTSASEVRGIVAEMQAAANSAVIAAEAASREVARATEQTQHTGEAIAAMVEQLDESAQAAREISLATQQQQSASTQVVVAMHNLSAVASQMASGSHAAATVASELAEIAADLKQTVGRFKVSDRAES